MSIQVAVLEVRAVAVFALEVLGPAVIAFDVRLQVDHHVELFVARLAAELRRFVINQMLLHHVARLEDFLAERAGRLLRWIRRQMR